MTQSAPQTGISLQVTKTINAPRERVFAACGPNRSTSINGEALTIASQRP